MRGWRYAIKGAFCGAAAMLIAILALKALEAAVADGPMPLTASTDRIQE